MLGPFRVRNVRRPYHNTIRPAQRRPSLGEDAIVCIEGDKYDHTIQEHPSAKLRYVDEDKDLIVVGSQGELEQRLSEPVPVRSRSRPRVSLLSPTRLNPSNMHVFEIDPMETTVQVWQEIEEQTKVILESQASDDVSPIQENALGQDVRKEDSKLSENGGLGKTTNTSVSPIAIAEEQPTAPETVDPYPLDTQKIAYEQPQPEKAAFPSDIPVLTEVGVRRAQEIGLKLKSSLQSLAAVHTGLSTSTDGNRWASYSTALQTSPTKIEKATADFSTPQGHVVGTSSTDMALPAANNDKEGALGPSFFQKVHSQLAKLASPDVAPMAESSDSKANEKTEKDLVRQKLRISTDCSRDKSEECVSVAHSEVEETRPLLPIEAEDKTTEAAYTLIEDKTRYDDAELVKQLIRRGIVAPSTTYEDLVDRLKKDERPSEKEDIEVAPEPPRDPVEVTVGKMLMQMVSSVISNLETLNSQLQGEARDQVPQEALRLRGYPDSAHADDMWRDIETLKDAFEEFDIATGDIMRTFKRMHDHDEFPEGSGMLRLNGFSNTRGPLPQIASALQNLVNGIQKTCIQAVGENGRRQYHIPRRLATTGYEDTWELRIEPIPHWAVESHVKDFVEKSLAEQGFDVTVLNVRIATGHATSFEVKGRQDAENVLRILSALLWSGQHIDVSMQRKLYPTVFTVNSALDSKSQANSGRKFEVSTSGTFHPPSPEHASQQRQDAEEKRKVIQDRRAAFRREYKARTQNVRFEESLPPPPPPPKEPVSSHAATNLEPHRPSRSDIIYRHVPNPVTNTSNIPRGRSPPANQSMFRPYSYETPSAPVPNSLHKRRSVPLFVRPRGRSPESAQPKQDPQLRRYSSVQFKNAPVPATLYNAWDAYNRGHQPAEGNRTIVDQIANAEHVDMESKFREARRVSADFREAHTVNKATSSGRPVSAYTSFPTGGWPGAEASLGESGLKRSYAYRDKYSHTGAEDVLGNQPQFPPLPSMEPLVPLRPNPVAPGPSSQRAPEHASAETQHSPIANLNVFREADMWFSPPPGASTKLYVGNLPVSIGDSWIQQRFENFGKLQSVKLVRDSKTGRSKGFCYVEYEKLAEALVACRAMNGASFYGCKLMVDFAAKQPAATEERKEQQQQQSAGESSGEFSLRMMGRGYPHKKMSLPIHSPERASLQAGAKKFGLARSVSSAARDSKSATGPAGRRPYSVNFDGLGRMDWDKFTTWPNASPVKPPAPAPESVLKPMSGSTAPAGSDPAGVPVDASSSSEIPGPAPAPPAAPVPAPAAPATASSPPTLFENFNIPGSWRSESRPVPAERAVSPPVIAHDPEYAKIVEKCLTDMKAMGYGTEQDGGDERLRVIAEVASGDIQDAIDMVEEEREAWKEKKDEDDEDDE